MDDSTPRLVTKWSKANTYSDRLASHVKMRRRRVESAAEGSMARNILVLNSAFRRCLRAGEAVFVRAIVVLAVVVVIVDGAGVEAKGMDVNKDGATK